MKNKKFLKYLSVIELLLSLMLMYLAGLKPAESARLVLISVLFGIGALISLGICD